MDNFENYMNPPVDMGNKSIREKILSDFEIYNDKRKVARRYNITVRQVSEILKENEV